jgi:MerR family transcriptional regulator, mercuric resistance operon regulatory protein
MPGQPEALTIGTLAGAAEVGVETVRYYQRRGLLPVPRAASGYRRYGADVLVRLRFIRRAQALGFTLEEIGELLQLQDGTDRRSVRRIAQARLAQLQVRIDDMQKMARTLQQLIHECEHGVRAPRCPIIVSIESSPDVVPAHRGRRARV